MIPHHPRWLCALLSAAFFVTAHAQVTISEFMAANVNTDFVDEDGSHADWIELHNAGSASVSLNGWYLTDTAADLRGWQFPVTAPAVVLAPGGRLVVWASGKDRKANATRLHTDFSLNKGGEYLALTRPDGFTIESHFSPTYPAQATDVSYGASGGRQWTTLAGPNLSTKWRVRVPQNDVEFAGAMAGWNTMVSFADTGWTEKGTLVSGGIPRGIGYDSGSATGARGFLVNYAGSPNGVVNDGTSVGVGTTGFGMHAATGTQPASGTPTLCLRTTFQAPDPTTIQSLRLLARYDDGFIVYLNGVEIHRVNAPAPPAWNSSALSDREDDRSEDYEEFVLSNATQQLVAGTNLLAVHAFNETRNSSGFLISPVLQAFQEEASGAGGAGYLATPTPGTENTIATTAIGPDIAQTTRNPAQPVGGAGSAPLLVTARVRSTLRPIASVNCLYKVNFGADVTVAMRDDGAGGDLLAVDGIYSANLPTTALLPGHLLRWRIVATDNGANQALDPDFRDPYDNDQYFGTMARTSIQSELPVLYWFQNSSGTNVFATTEGGGRASFFYKQPTETSGRFYDNVRLTLHGQSTAGFAKKSQNVNFNADNRFLWRTDEKDIRGMNLLSNYADKSKVRNALAWETWNVSGHPSHWCQPVRVQQVTLSNVASNFTVDDQFLGIMDMVEDGNAEFLERWNLDSNGALYKCYNNLENTQQNSAVNGGGVEKKTREYENFADLGALVTAMNSGQSTSIRRRWLYDNVDVPALINYLAVHNAIQSHDYGHKNYYIYRDTLGTGEWKLLPWDQDLSFGHRWTPAQNYFDDDIDSASSLFLGGGTNHLMQIVLATGSTELAQMYMRRLRTLMDQWIGTPAAPSNYFPNRISAWQNALDPLGATELTDAERDFRKWGFWVDGNGGSISWTDGRSASHRWRPTAIRITTENNTEVYPGQDPYPAYGTTQFTHGSVRPWLPGRREYFYTRNPTVNSQGVPVAQAVTPPLIIENVNPNPANGGGDAEFFIVRNANTVAVDVSGWVVTGAIDFVFPPGTVLPAQGTLTSDGTSGAYVNQVVVARKPKAFRARTQTPKALEYRLVTGGFEGRLSARGGTLQLFTPAGTMAATTTFTGTPTVAQNFLRVTELNFAPKAPNTSEAAALTGVQAGDFEFIELQNTGAGALALGGAQFDRGVTFVFPAGFSLAAGERCLVVANSAAFAVRYGGSGARVAGQFEGSLDNSGEELRILDAVGEEVLRFAYDPSWYPPAYQIGYSLVTRLATPTFNGYNAPTAWAISGQSGGTPGGADATFSIVFEGWRHDHFTTAEQGAPEIGGFGGDFDSDGRNTWAEYAYGSNPRVANGPPAGIMAMVDVDGTPYLAVTFTRRRNTLDVAYTVEASANLAAPGGWTAVNLPVGAPMDLGNGLETVTYRDSVAAGAGERFIRVRAARLP